MRKLMHNVVRQFSSALWPRHRPSASRVVAEIEVIDADKIAADLDVGERARRAAMEWQDGSARTSEADEQQIRRRHEDIMRGIVAHARRVIGELRTRWQEAAQKSDPRRLRELLATAQQQVVRENALLREQLTEAYRTVVRARRHLRALRDRYGIDPPAEPEHRGVILGALFFGLTIEALFNASFFGLGEDGGLLAGFTKAFLVAFVNVAASFGAGWAMRGLTFAGPRRIVGGVVAVVWGFGLLAYHLAVGHYRAALALVSPDQVMATAMDTYTTNLLLIQDFAAWLLMLIGLIFAVLAAFAGFALADPIPGWRAAVKQLEAAEKTYADLKNRFLTSVQRAYDTQLAAVDNLLAEARDAAAEAVRNVGEMQRCLETHSGTAASVATSYATVIRRYRQVFERVAGRPGPEHFRLEPRLVIPILVEGTPVPTVVEMVAERERRLSVLDDTADEVKRSLREHCMSAMTALPVLIADIEGPADGPPPTDFDGMQLNLWPSRNGGAHVGSN